MPGKFAWEKRNDKPVSMQIQTFKENEEFARRRVIRKQEAVYCLIR